MMIGEASLDREIVVTIYHDALENVMPDIWQGIRTVFSWIELV